MSPPRHLSSTPAGAVERVRAAGGRALRTLEWGAGADGRPVALLIHGLPGGAEDWQRLGPLLASEHHVVAIDRPGYGGSGARALPLGGQVEVYRALLGQITRAPALIVGHSYGAIPAAVLAAERPGTVGALALLAPALREQRAARAAPPGLSGIHRLLSRPASRRALSATILGPSVRGLLARVLDPMSFAPDPVDAAHRAGVRDRTLRPAVLRNTIEEALRLQAEAAHADAKLGEIVAPTAVIHGAGDRVVLPEAGAAVAESVPGAQLRQIEGGHMITVSRADEVAGLLRELWGMRRTH